MSVVYDNWKKAQELNSCFEILEYPLFTDAGQIIGYHIKRNGCPYEILNTSIISAENSFLPRMVLRVYQYLDSGEYKIPPEKLPYCSNMSVSEEIAVLLSLILGIRIKSGDLNRRCTNQNDLGLPIYQCIDKNPKQEKYIGEHIVLPSAVRLLSSENKIDIGGINVFYKFIDCAKEKAITILQAARLYRDSLMTIESDTQLSWIRLVSTIEVAAELWRKDEGLEGTVKNLNDKFPNIARLLKEYCKKPNDKPIDDNSPINERHGAELKFCAFILKHFPDEPSNRPVGLFSIGVKKEINSSALYQDNDLTLSLSGNWSPENILKTLIGIYKHRSCVLHGGSQFPIRMCRPPFFKDGDQSFNVERWPENVEDGDAVLISTFEYIVRKSLLNWMDHISP